MRKQISSIVLVLALVLFTLFLPSGCKNGSGGTAVTTAEAAAACQTVMGAINLVFNSGSTWVPSGSSVSWSGPGLSMSGTVTSSPPVNSYALALTFSGFSDIVTGYTVNGTVDWSMDMNTSSGVVTGTCTGSVTLSGGPVTSQTWNVSADRSSSHAEISFGGTVTCNGSSFDASTLSLNRVGDANSALQSVFFGMGSVMSNQPAWIPGSGNSVSYSATGVSMTGTRVTGPTTTDYDLTITFTAFLDSEFGYTLDGTVHFVLACDNAGPINSGSLSGTVTLATSPAGSITFTITNVVGTWGGSMTFTGRVVTGGGTVDAKMLVPG